MATTAIACGACTGTDAGPDAGFPTPPPASAPVTDAPHGTSDAPRVTDTIASGLDTPWGLAFLPDGSALVTERNSGRILAIDPGGGVRQVGVVDDTVARGESGLLGVAVSPTFDTDRYVFVYVTTRDDNRILRAEFDGATLSEPTAIVEGIPAARIHDGGRLLFGPDGALYAATGDAGNGALAQDPSSLGGKILRVTVDGDPAPGNPDPASPVYSLGHRNVQGLAFDDENRLWASEFGPNAVDELNAIVAGGNYGWPHVEGRGGTGGFVDPLLTWPVAEASPSGMAHARGRLWLASLRGERLWRIDLGDDGGAHSPVAFFTGDYGRLRTVVVAPDGSLWMTTSNRDGRGRPAPGDDRIVRVELP